MTSVWKPELVLAAAVLAGCAVSTTRSDVERCRSSADCEVGVCFLAQHACVECLIDADCGATEVCLGTHCAARVDCTSATECGGEPCDAARLHCVECVTASEWATGDACLHGGCEPPLPPECEAARDCATGERCLEGLCRAMAAEPSPAVSIGAGLHFACAALASGQVRCWGANDAGQLGDGTTTERHEAGPPVVGIDDAVAVAVGAQHACALHEGGGISCWGYGAFGNLGEGRGASSLVPVAVTGLSAPATGVSCGLNITCATLADGTAACWGDDMNGISADGSTGGTLLSPMIITGTGPGVASVVVGVDHACLRLESGDVGCWGGGYDGQLGDGGRGPLASVHWVTGGSAIGLSYMASCVVVGGAIDCWGHVVPTFEIHDVPTRVAGIDDAVEVEGGLDHVCARRASGGVTCWGSNANNQLGVTDVASSMVPIGAVGVDAVDIDLGAGFGCAIVRDGSVSCWGTNPNGELGNGSTSASWRAVNVRGL